MADVMVTGRMPASKKQAGNAVLQDVGLNASQAINSMYSKLIAERSASFLEESPTDDPMKWHAAASFIDSLLDTRSFETRFDTMSDAEIRMDRLHARGLV